MSTKRQDDDKRRIQARRKGIARRAREDYPGKDVGWFGGILYFLNGKEPEMTNGQPVRVPGVEPVVEPGQEAKGYVPKDPDFPPKGTVPLGAAEVDMFDQYAEALGIPPRTAYFSASRKK